jgi:hypothetical protein
MKIGLVRGHTHSTFFLFGKLKRSKENGISTKGRDRGRKTAYVYKQRLLMIQIIPEEHMASAPLSLVRSALVARTF